MTNRPNSLIRCATLLLSAGVLCLGWLLATAQPQFGARGKGVNYASYDSKNRVSSQIFAGEAAPKGNLVELTGLKVELYSYDSGAKATNLVVKAVDCLFDQKTKVAISDKAVEATTGDGKIKLAGTGFKFEQGGSKIIVSNQVVIEISRDMIVKQQKK